MPSNPEDMELSVEIMESSGFSIMDSQLTQQGELGQSGISTIEETQGVENE
jgi:hypothetical protein